MSPTGAVPDLPAERGTYLLLFELEETTSFDCGALGTIFLDRGWAGYAGSAFGGGGLAARLRRHLGGNGRSHWHVDYLRARARVAEIWFTRDPLRREHLWARVAGELDGGTVPVRGFGSSDCRCESHLVHLPDRPQLRSFRFALRQRDVGHAPVECRGTAV